MTLIDNRALLDALFAGGRIRLERGHLFDVEVLPKPEGFDFGRVEGMLLGLAIGDALGNTSESMTPADREHRHCEIRDYLFNQHGGDARGYPSDDTQLAFWTLESLIQHCGLNPERLAERFSRDRIYGVGSTMRGFLSSYKASARWSEAGRPSAGNGAIMRIAPLLVPHLRTGGRGLWADTAIAAMLTHNDPASTSACLAIVAMLWEVLDMQSPPPPRWWRDRYVELASDLEGDNVIAVRDGTFTDYEGPLWRFVQEKLAWAEAHDLSVRDACNAWHSGAYVLETVPCVLWTLMRHAPDPEEAVVRAVNETWDNDTTAAIVGAFVGALHGAKCLPRRWMDGLSGRTSGRDDGRIQDLIALARIRFVSTEKLCAQNSDDIAAEPDRQSQNGREAARVVMGAVAALHRQGYEHLRLYCYVKEGIGAMRYFVYASPTLPANLRALPGNAIKGSIGGGWGPVGQSINDLLAEWHSDYREVLELARGNDPAYVTWFSEALLLSSERRVFEMESPTSAQIGGRPIRVPSSYAPTSQAS